MPSNTSPLLYVLGAPRLITNGGEIDITQNRRSMIALYLATRDNSSSPITRNQLIDDFEFPSRNAFKVNLSRLRKEEIWYTTFLDLGGASIQSNRYAISFSPLTDYGEYNSSIQKVMTSTYTVDIMNFMVDALHWFRGDFMQGFDLSGQSPAIQELAARRRQVHVTLNNAILRVIPLLLKEEKGMALYLLEKLAKENSGSEDMTLAIMQCAASLGERQRALAEYEKHRRNLIALQMLPSPKIEKLKLDIEKNVFVLPDLYVLSTNHQPQDFTKHNLPDAVGKFICRSEILDHLGVFLREGCRLITIVGPGGVGKTRLAIEMGREYLPRFPDGVVFISLKSLQAKAEIWTKIARVQGILLVPQLDPLLTVIAALKSKRCLIIFDNAESVEKDFALQLEKLLKGTKSLHVLITSRSQIAQRETPILLKEEQQLHLRGMTYDEGCALFIERAEYNGLTSIEEIFFRRLYDIVEGMPLALEVLAGMHHMFTIQELYKLVEKTTLPLSDVGRSTRLKDVFQASFRKLTNELQDKYCQLSVFQHYFTAEMAESIIEVTTTQLVYYHRVSLLTINREGNYTLHPILHSFAEEELCFRPYLVDVYAKHARYFLKKLEQEYTQPFGSGFYVPIADMRLALQWLGKVGREYSSLSQCVFQVTGSDFIKYGEIAYHCELYTEAEDLLRSALAQFQVPSQERVLATFRLAQSIRGRDMKEAILRYQEAWRLLDDLQNNALLRAEILNHWGLLLSNINLVEAQNKLVQSQNIYKNMLTDFEGKSDKELGEIRIGIAKILRSLAQVAHKCKNSTQALKYLKESYTIFTEIPNILEQAKTLTNIGGVYYQMGKYEDAKNSLEKAISLYEKLGRGLHSYGIAMATNNLGLVYERQGNHDVALCNFEEAGIVCEQVGDFHYAATAFTNSAAIDIRRGNYSQAQGKLCRALQASYVSGNPESQRSTLVLFAEWATAVGDTEQACEIAHVIYLQENTEHDVPQRAKAILHDCGRVPTSSLIKPLPLEDLMSKILNRCNADVTP